MKKNITLSLIASFFLIGCGGGGSGSSSSKNSSTTISQVKVIDGYVIGAKVCDQNGHCAITDADGVARGNFTKGSILTSVGGTIDVNFNGQVDPGEPTAPVMESNSSIINPITTLIANGADVNKLSKMLDISIQEIYNEDPFQTNNTKLIKYYNAIYPVLKENKVKELVQKINNTDLNSPNTSLPPINGISNANLYSLVLSIISDKNDIAFINNVMNSNINNAKLLAENLDSLKNKNFIPLNNINTTANYENTNVTTNNISSNAISYNNNSQTNVNHTNVSSNKNDIPSSTALPNFDNPPVVKPANSSSNNYTDLPEVNSNNIKQIPTNNTYNPTYQPMPKLYYIQLHEFNNQYVFLNKKSDTSYSFKNILDFNVKNSDFNITKFFDINASPVYSDLNFTPDGTLSGNIKIFLKDENDSSEANITINNVKFIVNNKKVITSDLSNITYDVNQTTDNNYSNSINAGTYNSFDINLSRAYSGLDEAEYNQTNHIYDVSVEYNVSNTILTLSGKYKIVNITPPKITLNNNSYIVQQNQDVNFSIGTVNIPNIPCSINGVNGLNCEINGSGNILLYGKTNDNVGVKIVNITVNNQDMNDTNSFYIEIVPPITTQLVHEWNLSDNNYTGYHIEMNLTGSLDSNIVDVNTSETNVPSGSPENNVTVYLLNDSNDTSNYIIFKFDSNVYKTNDAFIIQRADGKKVIFRVGDVSSSNNTFVFK